MVRNLDGSIKLGQYWLGLGEWFQIRYYFKKGIYPNKGRREDRYKSTHYKPYGLVRWHEMYLLR